MHKKKIRVLVICGATLLAVLTGIFLILFLQKETVPNVIGKTAADAKSALGEKGFKVVSAEEYSDTVPSGIVISQDKDAESEARKWSTVKICISRGIEQIEVPNVENLEAEAAKDILTKSKLTFNIIEAHHQYIKKGKVISQDISAGTAVEKGTSINITVSLGKELIAVPSVKGISLKAAEEKLNGLGFAVEYDIKGSSSVKEDCIISQSINAGKKAEQGSKISLLVSVGKPNAEGNTNGNSINHGIVASQGNWIYYVNYNYNYYIYKMKKDGSEKQIVLSETAIGLNVVGEWIYYAADNGGQKGIYKVKLNGKDKTKISGDYSYYVHVAGDWIYYSGEWSGKGPLYKMKTDGSQKMRVGTDSCSNVNIEGNWIYYKNTADGLVYKMSTDGKNRTLLHGGFKGDRMVLCDGRLVAADMYDFNIIKTDGTGFLNYKESNKQKAFLTSCGGWVYYLEHDFTGGIESVKNSFCRIKPNGTGKEVIKEINFQNMSNYYVCVTDGWIYFPNEDDNGYIYRINISKKTLKKLYV